MDTHEELNDITCQILVMMIGNDLTVQKINRKACQQTALSVPHFLIYTETNRATL